MAATTTRTACNGAVQVLDRTRYLQRNPERLRYLAQCGQCLRTWDDGIALGVTPAPGARCPFEYSHKGEQ